MTFNDAEILSFTSQNNFLAGGEFRYGSTKVLSVTSVINSKTSNSDVSGVKESQEKLMEVISGAHDLQDIIINNVSFGSGRIISINSETAANWDLDNIRFGKHEFQIEIQDSGQNNLYNMTGNFLNGLKNKFTKEHQLQDFNEDFSFNLADNGGYSYNHSVSAKYLSGIEVNDPIGEARILASRIFDHNPSLGLLDVERSGFYNTDGKKYYTETYNLQDNSCSFNKTFESRNRYDKDDLFSSELTHSMASDENGIITISERGEVVGLDDDGGNQLFQSALDGLNQLQSNSFNRCTGVFDSYSGFYGGDINNLNSQFINFEKSINKLSSSISYDISYNNAPNFSGLSGFHDVTLSIDAPAEGVRTVVERGTVATFKERGEIHPMDLYSYFNVESNSPYRCGNFYSGVVENKRNGYNFFQKDRFNLTNSSLAFQESGKTVSYERTFSDDPSIVNTNKISILNISSSDRFKTTLSEAYFIPNQQKEILHSRGVTSLSSRSISADCTYQRPDNNFWTDISYAPVAPESNSDFYDALKFVKNKMLEKAFDASWISIEEINKMYINSFTYSVNSDQSLSVNMEVVYEED